MILAKSLGMLIFTVILTVCALLAGAKVFLQGFLLSFGLMCWIGAYDTFFIDWILFATLGALSTRGGQMLKNKKRHPTIEDNVTIYPDLLIQTGSDALKKSREI